MAIAILRFYSRRTIVVVICSLLGYFTITTILLFAFFAFVLIQFAIQPEPAY